LTGESLGNNPTRHPPPPPPKITHKSNQQKTNKKKKKKKKELNEYSPVRQACYARGEAFITDFQITGEQHWNMCDFLLFVKKTFSIDPSCVVALYDSQSYFSTK